MSKSADGLAQRDSGTTSVQLASSEQVETGVSYNDNVDDNEEDEYGSEDDNSPLFPNQLTATLKQHKKVVSALAIDPSGARFATGAHDYDVKLWDFGGMGGGVGKAFKSFEPAENYYVSYICLLDPSLRPVIRPVRERGWHALLVLLVTTSFRHRWLHLRCQYETMAVIPHSVPAVLPWRLFLLGLAVAYQLRRWPESQPCQLSSPIPSLPDIWTQQCSRRCTLFL